MANLPIPPADVYEQTSHLRSARHNLRMAVKFLKYAENNFKRAAGAKSEFPFDVAGAVAYVQASIIAQLTADGIAVDTIATIRKRYNVGY